MNCGSTRQSRTRRQSAGLLQRHPAALDDHHRQRPSPRYHGSREVIIGIIRPTLPPYDPLDWQRRPFPERARMVCASWATQGYGTPVAVFALYAVKIAAYIIGWALFCSASLGSLADIGSWWLTPLALQKAVLWSMLFEVTGLGCGSGPLTARYVPPVGGALYFLRPGTVRLPLLGAGTRRRVVDVLLYASLLVALVVGLLAPALATRHLLAVAGILGVLGLRDKTILLAARAEHYLVVVLVFLLADDVTQWLAGSMAVWGALWFFAGFSKLNHHFSAVVCVMMSNSPVVRSVWLRKKMYRDFPDDLRPSTLAHVLGHFGTALELSVPVILLLTTGPGPLLVVGMVLMLALHSYITANVPMGVPLEWNVLVVYGAVVLFWGHPEVTVLDMGLPIAALVLTTSVALPLLGNRLPAHISFLPSMRYYAGNWAMSVWLFEGESHRKLHENLTMTSPWVTDQIDAVYDDATITALLGKVMAFRLMHLHGRTLGALLPTALGGRALSAYTWVDGEIVAGLVLGWNFGDGHLHDERMLGIIQDACGFAPGELRCIFVESQPLLSGTLHCRVHDAADGLLHETHLSVSALRARQPWTLGGDAGA